MDNDAKHLLGFGPFRVDPDERLPLRDHQPIPLPPKAFDLLVALLQGSGQLVLKDDLMKGYGIAGRKGNTGESCSILTTTPNVVTSAVHDRMPFILDRDCYDLWLDPGMREVAVTSEMLKPYDARLMRCYPISTRINHVANDERLSWEAEPTREVLVTIGRPIETAVVQGECYCPSRTTGLGNDEIVTRIFGIDACQAIEPALKVHRWRLADVNVKNGGRLRWLDERLPKGWTQREQ